MVGQKTEQGCSLETAAPLAGPRSAHEKIALLAYALWQQ